MEKMCPFKASNSTHSNEVRCERGGCGVWNTTYEACGMRMVVSQDCFPPPPKPRAGTWLFITALTLAAGSAAAAVHFAAEIQAILPL